MKSHSHTFNDGSVGTKFILSGNEVARAISAYLVAHRWHVSGPRTIRLLEPDPGQATGGATILVDPSGKCHRNPK